MKFSTELFVAESFDMETFTKDEQMECKGYDFIPNLFEAAGLLSKVICIQKQDQLLTMLWRVHQKWNASKTL